MKRAVRMVKYILLIPVRILSLPRIYRRLVAVEARLAAETKWREDETRSVAWRVGGLENKNLDARLSELEEKLAKLEQMMRNRDLANTEFFEAEKMVKALAANLRDLAQVRQTLAKESGASAR